MVFRPFIHENQKKIKILIPECYTGLIESGNVIPIPEVQLDKKKLPTTSLNKKIFKDSYYAVCDLNRMFNPTAVYVAIKSNAEMKIGFKTKHSDHFYNLQISVKNKDDIESGYLNIRNLLEIDIKKSVELKDKITQQID